MTNKSRYIVAGCAAAALATLMYVDGFHKALPSSLAIKNTSDAATVAYLSFGADSVMKPDSFKTFCTPTGPLNCHIIMATRVTQTFPPIDKYLNVTISFGGQGCGTTKAELNMSNPSWYDTYDVSLVDGYSNKVSIVVGDKTLGPPVGKDGNEKVYGLYLLGCDICVDRQNPPCGISTGKTGCKSGGQYTPDVPCQHQGSTMGGGGAAVTVTLQP